jgi:hypothetical protein
MHSLDDIFSGSSTVSPPLSDAAAYELMRSIGRELKARHVWNKNVYEGNDDVYAPERKRWVEQANNALCYMLDNFTSDQCIAGYKVLLQDFLLPFDPNAMPAFDRFSERHRGDVLRNDGFGPLGDEWREAAIGSHYDEN